MAHSAPGNGGNPCRWYASSMRSRAASCSRSAASSGASSSSCIAAARSASSAARSRPRSVIVMTLRRGQERVARAWATLMERLGYRRYGAHGGDWGSGISRLLAAAAPDRVVGVHVNYLPTPGSADGLGAEDLRRLEKTRRLAANRHPHQILFASRPQTLAYAFTDSPAGQLAFLAEKFDDWTDPAAPLSDDVILTDVMHYWITRTAASSSRLVKESGLGGPVPCPVPLGVAVLPHDILQAVRPLAEQRYDVKQWSEFDRGGHFAALEVPTPPGRRSPSLLLLTFWEIKGRLS
jgi:pimeloyl-ACP methyl ester carboxylesterase